MKNKGMFLFIVALFTIFAASGEVLAGADKLCPLPDEYKVKMDSEADFADPGTTPPGKALTEVNVNEAKNGSTNASFVIDENAEKTWSFRALPGSVLPEAITGVDSDTNKYEEWQPKHMSGHHYHDDDKSKMTMKVMESTQSCFRKVPGRTQPVEHYWDQTGWKVNTVFHVYHMDSPTKYGNCGHIGYQVNKGETRDDSGAEDGFGEFKFAYRVPSVPIWYAVSSAMTINWDWQGTTVRHGWKAQHPGCCPKYYGTVPCPICQGQGHCTGCMFVPWQICQQENSLPENQLHEPPDTVSYKEWYPNQFWDGSPGVEQPNNSKISGLKGSKHFDEQGISGEAYSVPGNKLKSKGGQDAQDSKPIVVARATVRVKDLYNVAHVQVGTSENKATLQAECGKKISEIADKEMVIRIVDNAPHSTKLTVVDNTENTCVDGDWDENKFKVIFWYEMPLYQYASYIGDKWKDAGGVEKPLIEVAYSPMFVWKKHTLCTKLTDFFNTTDGSTSNTSKVYWYNNEEHVEYQLGGGKGQDLGNPIYVIYEKKIPVSKLFVSDDDPTEDIMPWHYATTALGDGFGNPPYSKDVSNDLYGYSKDNGGGDIMGKFKYKPMDFTKGKGHLKYFVEVHDCSTLTKGGALKSDEQKFDCSGTYFKEDKYEQGQLKYNPEVVKYMQYSSSSADVSPGAQIDPTQSPNQNALPEDYQDYTKEWDKNTVLTNNLNTDVDGGTEVVKNFQAFGRVEIKDTIKPNVGLKIMDTVRGSIRKVYKINDLTTLACYKDLSSSEGKNWALVDNDKHNYKIKASAKTPRAPFALNDDAEKLWEFKDVQLLVSTSPNNGRIWEGKDFEGTFPDSMQDSLAPYGTAEDTKLEITHQDMRNDVKKSNFVTWFAHDNIDGQRVNKDSAQVKKGGSPYKGDDFWYKGVTSMDFDAETEKNPQFPDDFINKGYSSWLIKDESYVDSAVFDQMYKNGNYFKYPDLSFNNPNRKWDGSALPNGDKEISVAYGVMDQAGNKRKLKLWMYVAPLDMKIMTIEKNEKRTE